MILLIAAVLNDEEMSSLIATTERLGMQALVETHAEDEVKRAVDAGAKLIGVNNRNLSSFEVDLRVSENLRKLIPDDLVAVAESGIRDRVDLLRLQASGYSVFLVGSSLMASPNPGAGLKALVTGS